MDKDDLSLLANFTEKERRKHHDKGIFTVTQLSYTFRPRRRGPTSQQRHDHALQALAIRLQKIHVFGSDLSICSPTTPIYFDVEGDPDRDFYYLVGLRLRTEAGWVQRSVWAETTSAEKAMWEETIAILQDMEDPTLIHYGSYETLFLKRMWSRYGGGSPGFVEGLIANSVNILATLYGRIYFPTYSNGLNEIGEHLGFRWSTPSPSGLDALVWRVQYEQSQDRVFKNRLIAYNTEDCRSLELVTETVWTVLGRRGDTADGSVLDAAKIRKEFPQRFGAAEFLLPDFKTINEAAYWDYQRSKVYVRTGAAPPHNRANEGRRGVGTVPANKIVEVHEARPESCPHCHATLIYKWGTLRQTVIDLRFSKRGIKRWVVQFVFRRFICWGCRRPLQFYTHKPKYGVGLFAYVLYEMFEMGASQGAIAASLKRLFGLPFSRGAINHLKESADARFRPSYEEILHRIVHGRLIHVDETKARVAGQEGYVWVFASMEDVAFVYKPSREAEFLRELLRTFQGVVVSDFFSGYDGLPCAQQKCLIHLMRDINNDLRKQPFNLEMTGIAEAFAGLLRPIVATVDRYGLKARHLGKHRTAVDRFYSNMQNTDYATEVARSYQKRFERNRLKLFTFLEHDGVPWNNNNAEHSIKAFARLRRTMGGASTVKGMEEYLVLLSVSETCKSKGRDTLKLFLGEVLP